MAPKQKLALVIGHVPSVEEVDQFQLLAERYEVNVVCSESICGYLTQTSYFQDLTCVAVPDHDENPTFLPGLEKVLKDYDVVVVKERLGLYAYQAVKAKWQHRFHLVAWVDNATPFAGHDVQQMRTVRQEITRGADAFLVQTKAARQALVCEGVEEERIHDFLPFVEKRVKRTKKGRAEALKALGIAESSFLIAHVGQIEWEEGLSDLAAGIKLAFRDHPGLARKLRIVFCGVGSFGPELRNTFRNLGLDDVPIYTAPSRRAMDTILMGADALYFSSIPSRDRVDCDPYRLLSAMVHEIPVIASRSPVVEEIIGKHRIDFCQGSAVSIAQALEKVESAEALKADLVKKNADEVKARFAKEKVAQHMAKTFDAILKSDQTLDETGLDQRILEVEGQIRAGTYLDAVTTIEGIFKMPEIPVPHKANLYRLVGDCFAKLGDPEAAKDAYLSAGELDPFSAKVWIGLGTISLLKGGCDVAVLHFQKAVSLAPEDEMANLGLGLAFQGLREFKEASRWVAKALDFNRSNTAALFTLTQLVHETGNFALAEKHLRSYLGVNPEDLSMKFALGGILYRMNRNADALEVVDEILKANPNDERALGLKKQINGEVVAEASSSQG